MALPFFRIGHSTRSINEFLSILSDAGVRLVVDVRKIPRSRANPQFNSEENSLSSSEVDYEHVSRPRGPPAAQPRDAGGIECVLGESKFSQLRGLRYGRGLPIRLGKASRVGAR